MTGLTLSVVSHGHGPLLQRLLRQLESQPSLAGTRVIVTLNLPSEAFQTGGFSSLRLSVTRNDVPQGFGANHNAAFRFCDTAWFGVLNPDLALSGQEPFRAAIEAIAQQPDVAVVAPCVVNERGAPEDSVRTNLTPWSLVRRRVSGKRAPLTMDTIARPGAPFFWLAGMCLLVKAEAFREVGGFDDRFFLYCEDYDLCARLYNAGYGIALAPHVKIVHAAQRDSHRSLRHLKWHLLSLLKVWTSRAFWRVTLHAG